MELPKQIWKHILEREGRDLRTERILTEFVYLNWTNTLCGKAMEVAASEHKILMKRDFDVQIRKWMIGKF